MSRRLVTRVSEDYGVYSILYALLVVVLLGMGALVVDLATLREERRTSRLATDAAATAGAVILDPASAVKPKDACNQAWASLVTNLRTTGVSPCSGFTDTTCPATAKTVTGYLGSGAGRYTVVITWPVPNTNSLMTNPTVQGGFTQAIDPTVDGDTTANPNVICSRLGVTLTRTRSSTFAGIFPVPGNHTVVSSSVALAMPKTGNPPVIAALNILETVNCDAAVTSGQGNVIIQGATGGPGVVAIESSGREQAGKYCPPNDPYVLDVASNLSGGGYFQVDGETVPATGIIQMYALDATNGNLGSPNQAYDKTLVGSQIRASTPIPVNQQFGDAPVRDIMGPYITQLETAFNATPIQNYAYSDSPGSFYTLQDGTPIPGTSPVQQFKCQTSSSDHIRVPFGNWYIDCGNGGNSDLNVNGGVMIFAGGNIVTRKGVTVGSDGCLAVNVPAANANACPTIDTTATPKTTVPAPTKDAILYIRDGGFSKGAQASILMPRTFTYLKPGNSASINLGGGSTGHLLITHPTGGTCAAADDVCREARFRRLVFWTDSTQPQTIGGQAGIVLVGTIFTPKAPFTYDGQGASTQEADAQFWVRTLTVKSQGIVTMKPDVTSSFKRPYAGVALIR